MKIRFRLGDDKYFYKVKDWQSKFNTNNIRILLVSAFALTYTIKTGNWIFSTIIIGIVMLPAILQIRQYNLWKKELRNAKYGLNQDEYIKKVLEEE